MIELIINGHIDAPKLIFEEARKSLIIIGVDYAHARNHVTMMQDDVTGVNIAG